jgi:hypothetical protein
MQLWVASKDGQDVGRIAGIIDDSHVSSNGVKAAHFGFFETVDDPEVAHSLFDTVADWARKQGAAEMLGPMNPTTNDECGLLVEGFNSPPVFMMPYNPAYYVRLVEAQGYAKAKDLLAYMIDLAGIPMDRLTRIADIVRRRNPVCS